MQYLLLIYEDDAERIEKMDERMPHCAAYVEVPDLDTALAWAARCPSASRGLVEVRPIWPS